MKKSIYTIVIFLLTAIRMYSQPVQEYISVYPIVDSKEFDVELNEYLKEKVQFLLAKSGILSLDYCERFVFKIKPTLEQKRITQSYPTRIISKYSFSFTIGDIIENKVFGAMTISSEGIGKAEKQSIKNCISLIKPSKEFDAFLEESLNSIENYYSTAKPFISKAALLEKQGREEEAVAYLMSIPYINETCIKECQEYAIRIYSNMIETHSYQNYQSAKAIWLVERNSNGAKNALAYLKQVSPASRSYKEALALWKDISNTLEEIERQEYEQAQKEYNDSVAFRSRLIDACESVAVAYFQNRPSTINNIIGLW